MCHGNLGIYRKSVPSISFVYKCRLVLYLLEMLKNKKIFNVAGRI